MKKRILIIFMSIIILIVLTACGASQVLLNETATPVPTSTPLPTSTPTPIPGFAKFEAENIEIWLPDSFSGGDLENDLDVIVNRIKSLGPQYEQMAEQIKANPSAFVLWAFDSNIGSSGGLTNVNIGHEQVISAMTEEMYVEAIKRQLPSSFIVSDPKEVKLGPYDALQLIIQFNQSGISAKELYYVIKNNDIIWGITYSTGADEFNDRLPVFEQSAQTFYIHP